MSTNHRKAQPVQDQPLDFYRPSLNHADFQVVAAMTRHGVPRGTVVEVFETLTESRTADAISRAKQRAEYKARETIDAIEDYFQTVA